MIDLTDLDLKKIRDYDVVIAERQYNKLVTMIKNADSVDEIGAYIRMLLKNHTTAIEYLYGFIDAGSYTVQEISGTQVDTV